MNDYIKKAEQATINVASKWKLFDKFLWTIAHFGNKHCNEHISKSKFFEGLQMLRSAASEELQYALFKVMEVEMLGGESTHEFLRKEFSYLSDEDVGTMYLLDEDGVLPRRFSVEEHKEFKKQIREKLGKG